MGGSGFSQIKRCLVLGPMPAGAAPETHFPAGPWCFLDQEDAFPGWEKRFHFAPEPLANPALLPAAAKAAQALAVNQIPRLAASLDRDWRRLPLLYWQTFLLPWAIDVARQVVDRSLRSRALIDKWGEEEFCVEIYPENLEFAFQDEHDFTLRGSLGQIFNQWLFAFLLRAQWPRKWRMLEREALPALPVAANSGKSRGLAARCRELLRGMALNLPFPKLKGMSVTQAFRFSSALLHPCRQPDHSLDLEAAFSADDIGIAALPCDTLPVFIKALPQSLKKPLKIKHLPPFRKARLRVASVLAYENAAYRRKLAIWRARGGRLAFVQHGGNYGQVETTCDAELVEYSQDTFFTWGWKRHGRIGGNFIPAPYPQINNLKDSWQEGEPHKFIFVGAEMAAFGYRLDSNPTPLQFLEYRRQKALFFRAIGEDLRKKTLYRPYFPLPGTLADAPWLLKRFPDLKVCKGPLAPQMLACRALVMDHHGTVMLEALAANIPLILYWRREFWPLHPDCAKLLDMLEAVGIWHPSAEAAAARLLAIQADPKAWWTDKKIQEARALYCERQAMLASGSPDPIWMEKLKKL